MHSQKFDIHLFEKKFWRSSYHHTGTCSMISFILS